MKDSLRPRRSKHAVNSTSSRITIHLLLEWARASVRWENTWIYYFHFILDFPQKRFFILKKWNDINSWRQRTQRAERISLMSFKSRQLSRAHRYRINFLFSRTMTQGEKIESRFVHHVQIWKALLRIVSRDTSNQRFYGL